MSTTIYFFFFIPILALILLTINLMFAPRNPYQEKDTPFECGFHSFLWQNRTQFSISFFIFALLFLLFDLEILLIYPYIVSAYTNSIYGLVIMLIFFIILTLGFAFELGKKALFIENKQVIKVSNKNSKNFEKSLQLLFNTYRWYIKYKSESDSNNVNVSVNESESESVTQVQEYTDAERPINIIFRNNTQIGSPYFHRKFAKRVSTSKRFVRSFSESAHYFYVSSEKDKYKEDLKNNRVYFLGFYFNKLKNNSFFRSFLYYICVYRYLIYFILSIAFLIIFTTLYIELFHVYDIGLFIFYPIVARNIYITHYKKYKYLSLKIFLKYICHYTFYTSFTSLCWILLLQWPLFIVY